MSIHINKGERNKVEIGQTVYHGLFGECVLTHPKTDSGKVLVELKSDEIEYYENFKLIKSLRSSESGRHILLTPVSHLFENKKDITIEFELKKLAMRVKVK